MIYSRIRLKDTRTTMFLPRLLLGTSLRTFSSVLMALTAMVALAGGPTSGAQETGGGAAQQAGVSPRGTEAGAYSEEQVKAAFLFHFATYAEWPSHPGDGPISFAVLRDEAIARELGRFARGRTIQNRPVRVREIRSVTELDADEVLFIGSSQNRRLSQVIEEVGTPTLVVTDAPDGLPDGAMINFQLVDRRVRFEVALPAVQRMGLTLSSRLLSAAIRVEMTRCHLECYISEDEQEAYAVYPALLRMPSRA